MKQLKPFVPGIARGVVCRGSKAVSPDSIAILTQHELAELAQHPAGILVVEAAPLSHAMIRLMTLAIPTVLIGRELADGLEVGTEVVIDGLRGTLHDPADAEIRVTKAPTPPAAGAPILLSDGSHALLSASIFSVDQARCAVEQGAAAIGLVRSEFMLPPDGRIPDAAFYESALRELYQHARQLQVTIRLPDIAADKPVAWFRPADANGVRLGYQGIRLYDQEPVRRAVNALLGAINSLSGEHQPRLLLPYVTSLEEFGDWRHRLEQHLNTALPTGAMLESPAAVMAMPHWFDVADFVAIGCNDLMQCFFATDRDAARLNHYLDPYTPGLFRFLKQAADEAGDRTERVQLCGLLPQLPAVLPVLLGMGFRVFSLAPVMIPYLANVVNGIDLAHAVQLMQRVCAAKNATQVRQLLLGER